MSKFDDSYKPSLREQQAYAMGYSAVENGVPTLDLFEDNPFDHIKDMLLWEAWEIGFNDAFDDYVKYMKLMGL